MVAVISASFAVYNLTQGNGFASIMIGITTGFVLLVVIGSIENLIARMIEVRDLLKKD